MLQLVTSATSVPIQRQVKLAVDFIEELAGQEEEMFVRLPDEQPPYASNLSGKVISARKLPGMLRHAIGLTRCRDDDNAAAASERTMIRQGEAPQYHLSMHNMLRNQAVHRDEIAFNLMRNILEARILGEDEY